MSAIVGKKLGMTRIFTEDGTAVPVTVIEAVPNRVTAIRRGDRDGYDAIQLAADPVAPEGKLTRAELGHLKKAGAPAMRTVVEFRDAEIPSASSGEEASHEKAQGEEGEPAETADTPAGEAEAVGGVKLGDEVTVASFEPGQQVKVSAVSRGKGFQGTIKRHNFSRGPETHGSHNVRAPGSIGASADPARVFKGMKMPGQMGARRVTQRGAHVVEVDAERNLLLIRGSVPGGKNATVEVRSDG
ncbi:MAG TPA: 50S ribosomal protein L3 [Solirubrobacterales bacterium]|nr:50S ribosomal protein L3 [Solirubrobacterales bacterium]